MQAVIQQDLVNPVIVRKPDGIGRKIGLFGSIFGCWHKRLTKPMSDRNTTYQACVECGARRRYDAAEFRARGPFYYPSADAKQLSASN